MAAVVPRAASPHRSTSAPHCWTHLDIWCMAVAEKWINGVYTRIDTNMTRIFKDCFWEIYNKPLDVGLPGTLFSGKPLEWLQHPWNEGILSWCRPFSKVNHWRSAETDASRNICRDSWLAWVPTWCIFCLRYRCVCVWMMQLQYNEALWYIVASTITYTYCRYIDAYTYIFF